MKKQQKTFGIAGNCLWMAVLLQMMVAPITMASGTTGAPIQKETGNSHQLSEIVVSATREDTPKQDVAANIIAVDREAIEKMPAATAAEVLQYVPGVYVEFNGGPAWRLPGFRDPKSGMWRSILTACP
ncbi:MAG: TonB-dependent receptor plug domain-containing protein [Desulfobacterales bacterium]